MATFSDLTFIERSYGKQAKVFFSNGYGASVICRPSNYVGHQGLYELAVIAGRLSRWNLVVHDTPITDGVLEYLTEDAVTDVLARIEALPAREAAQ